MENQETMRIITLADLWEVFISHIVPVILAAIVAVAAVFACSELLVTPKYNSTATLYILHQNNSSDYVYTQSDFSLALNVVNDCTYMLKSHAVLDDVIDDINLDISYEQLHDMISTANPDNTRVVEVSVATESAEESKRIVDSVCRIAAEKITDAMGMDQVNVYSNGTLEEDPCNTVGIVTYALIGIVAAIVMYAIYLIGFVLDDKIHTEEDVKKYLGLSVLGEIPNSNESKRKKNKYGYYYAYKSSNRQGKGGNKR